MGNWEEELDARTGAKRNWAPVHFPFDESAWIFALPAKEETVLQSTNIQA